MEHLAEYAGLLAASFLAATVLPFQSEAVLFTLLLTKHYTWWTLVLLASTGNTGGSVVNWALGRSFAQLEVGLGSPSSAIRSLAPSTGTGPTAAGRCS